MRDYGKEKAEMKKKFLLICSGLFVLWAFWLIENSLYLKLKLATFGSGSRVGIAVLSGDKVLTVGKGAMPLMSVFKMFVALNVLEHQEKDKVLTVTEEMINRDTYSPMLKDYPVVPFKISVAELLKYMVSASDNNATDILLAFGGDIRATQDYVRGLGFPGIVLKVNEQEMHENIRNQYLNRAVPADVVKLLRIVRESELLTNENKRFFEALMTETVTGADKIKKYLPSNVVVGHKTGSSDRLENGIKIADNDVGFVRLPDGREYYLGVMIADSPMSDRDNAELIARISKIVYRHFEENRRF